MTDNYGEHQCAECGTPLSRPGLCARCKALNSCSGGEQPRVLQYEALRSEPFYCSLCGHSRQPCKHWRDKQ